MKKVVPAIGIVAVLAIAGWAAFGRGGGPSAEIEYRYAPVEEGELLRSISATGQLVALTKVDIRSKAGGKIISLAVEEGDVVKQGDLVAIIDPADTQTTVDQASADLRSAEARAQSARVNYELEVRNRANAVADAEVALQTARTRLSRIQVSSSSQPALTGADLDNASAALEAQRQTLAQLTDVEVPRMRKDAQVGADQARVAMDAAQAELSRQERLLQKEFVSQSDVDRARTSYESARANHANAQERLRTVERDIDLMLASQRARVKQAEAALRSAQANKSRVTVSQKELEEARQAVRAAELNLQRAQNDLAQSEVRAADRRSAEASIVRSEVSLRNARVQLGETTVVAPRDGVVTTKYLEEGTIIPPGTSTFSQGTAIVEVSDVTQMFVECAVDEADVAQVKPGQRVRILLEAYPGERLSGIVERINPAAQTEQNITAIKVRVKIEPSRNPKISLKPGMNATCEFLTLNKQNAILVPSQAVQREDGKAFVRIKTANALKPERVEVKIGEEGNEHIEILEGVKAGQEVVIAELNLAQMREIQQRMTEVQQGGGLVGGQNRGGPRATGGGTRSMGGGSGGGSGGGGPR